MPTFNYPQDFIGTGWLLLDGDIYTSSTGNDVTGTGSPSNPYATIQKAVDVAANSKRIIVGTGNYNENVDGKQKGNSIVADGLVIMNGGNTAFSNMGSGTDSRIEGIYISGYVNAINNKMALALNCTFKNTILEDFRGTLQGCIIENVLVRATANTFLYNCTLVNVQTENVVAKTKFKEVLDTHISAGSVLNLKSATLTVFDYSNQEPGSTVNIDNTAYSSAAQVHTAFSQYQTHGVSLLPQFNIPAMGDYSLKPLSPLLTISSKKQFIGAVGMANSQNSNSLNGAALNHVTIDNDGKYILVPGYKVGTIETLEIDLGSKRMIGKINLFAEQHFETPPFNAVVDTTNTNVQPNRITFELRYADDIGETADKAYQEFIWNKQPTLDTVGLSNGDENFDESSVQSITARYVQLRITLREDTNFLLQENGYYILQESSSAIVLE